MVISIWLRGRAYLVLGFVLRARQPLQCAVHPFATSGGWLPLVENKKGPQKEDFQLPCIAYMQVLPYIYYQPPTYVSPIKSKYEEEEEEKRSEEWPIDCWPLVLNGPQRVNSFFFFSLSYYIATQHVTHNKHGQWGVHTTLEKKKIKREGRCVCGGEDGKHLDMNCLSYIYIHQCSSATTSLCKKK